MFFKNKDKHVKKIDKIVTWIIIWSAVAWAVWLSQTKKWKEITTEVKNTSKNIAWLWVKLAWKSVLKVLNLFSKKK